MADSILIAEQRTERGSGPAGRLRRTGRVPAVVYGLDAASVSVSVPARELSHILAGEAGVNTLITLRVDGDDVLTLARQIQRNPVRGDLEHVDFVRVRRDVAVSAEVPIHLVGEAPGVRDGGLLEQQLFTLTVEAKPEDIPNAVELDVSTLEMGDQLRVQDIPLPRGVATTQDPEETVAVVAVPRGTGLPEEEGEGAEGEEGAAAEASSEGGGDAGGESGGESAE
ncbi:MAG TPA: 50S ribosomal protein L25 [Acidimicrobiia bacterium]|jgi:large subunit ribosomal protein L25